MRFKLTEELQENIEMLRQIRSDESAAPSVRVQAAQALIKMLTLQKEEEQGKGSDTPTPAGILEKIREEKGKAHK